MIIFKTLTYRNFLSAGDYDTTIELDKNTSTLIVGANGSGKSTILDAISFALFGKPHRNISKPQLVNSINGKNCVVEIEFTIGITEYSVVRGIKPNVFEIYQNGILMNQESHNRDYQKVLEMNILKLSHRSFHQIVVLGSSNFIPFMQLPTGTRREVIEDLLDITIFTKMNMLLKTDSAKLKDRLIDVNHQYDMVSERIRLKFVHLEKLQQLCRENNEKLQVEIDEIQLEIKKSQSEYTQNSETAKELHESYSKAIEKVKSKMTSLESYKVQIDEKTNSIRRDTAFFEKNSECPTCTQVISSLIRDKKISDSTTRIEELCSGMSKLKEEITKTREDLDILMREMNSVQKYRDKAHSALIRKESNLERIKKIQDRISSSKETNDFTEENTELGKLYAEKSNIETEKTELVDTRAYNEVLAELLKDTGIKTKITQQYIPVINTMVNKFLQSLDFFVLFNLDENFNETIKSRYRDDFSYASFSEGEKQRIDLALLFTWRQIAKMKNSTSTNLLILDETFDSSLDADGVDNLLKILKTIGEDTNIFVISHKQDLLDGKFASKIEFAKVNNFSRLK
jgi:DNA repair exonuclease SbcCD ATPase subunit